MYGYRLIMTYTITRKVADFAVAQQRGIYTTKKVITKEFVCLQSAIIESLVEAKAVAEKAPINRNKPQR